MKNHQDPPHSNYIIPFIKEKSYIWECSFFSYDCIYVSNAKKIHEVQLNGQVKHEKEVEAKEG
ncbi:hypothetical protein J14TS2_05700 [Bacillus sp. J14TS2]|nr:hypothetical protein J14TS2_05700 [Bacillus sp. J14TS2]